MIGQAEPTTEVVPAWGGRLDLHVDKLGSGPPLLYLHPAGGLWWDPFLRTLAQHHTVYAPRLPGTAEGDSMAIHQLDSVGDLVLAYEGALRHLGLTSLPIIGTSFGGMVAAELAATFPDLPARLVLLAPGGLWQEDLPYNAEMMISPELAKKYLFADPDSAATRTIFPEITDPAAALDAAVNLIWATGCAAKFFWPIQDRGLSRRLHRITAPTLIVWGKGDAVVPAGYAAEYARLVPHATVELLDECGHVPQLEQLPQTLGLVTAFLEGRA
ncbi:alpha/beta fold hydrolase [Amycolatopsis jejuensis]|uniref:alpha/beta fold hydrolase n=1 Tax=Amycolatopsis jejuensis TaxID=330084 RepID=UPI000524DC16|nr:alpha/beta fold hydrolase [Amycolatopsis jejuensis]